MPTHKIARTPLVVNFYLFAQQQTQQQQKLTKSAPPSLFPSLFFSVLIPSPTWSCKRRASTNDVSLPTKLLRIYGRSSVPLRSKRSREGRRWYCCLRMQWICGWKGLIGSIAWTRRSCSRRGVREGGREGGEGGVGGWCNRVSGR